MVVIVLAHSIFLRFAVVLKIHQDIRNTDKNEPCRCIFYTHCIQMSNWSAKMNFVLIRHSSQLRQLALFRHYVCVRVRMDKTDQVCPRGRATYPNLPWEICNLLIGLRTLYSSFMHFWGVTYRIFKCGIIFTSQLVILWPSLWSNTTYYWFLYATELTNRDLFKYLSFQPNIKRI